jgi:hypothetical protein
MIKPKEYIEISKMKPDLNTEELIAKRKNLERIKEFSKQLKSYNKEVLSNQPKLPAANEQLDLEIAKKKYDSNRIRAMEYAKHIPKPKVMNDNDNNERRASISAGSDDGGGVRNGGGLYMDEDAMQAARLQELEVKHAQGKARLDAIKKSMVQQR